MASSLDQAVRKLFYELIVIVNDNNVTGDRLSTAMDIANEIETKMQTHPTFHGRHEPELEAARKRVHEKVERKEAVNKAQKLIGDVDAALKAYLGEHGGDGDAMNKVWGIDTRREYTERLNRAMEEMGEFRKALKTRDAENIEVHGKELDSRIKYEQGTHSTSKIVEGIAENERVFCYRCHNEWKRVASGLVCPRCNDDFTEIVS